MLWGYFILPHPVEHSDSGKKKIDSIQFTLTNRFFDSIPQFDKTDACM